MFIYENSDTPTRTQNLEKLLQAYHYKYEIVGKGHEWDGWYGRVSKYREHINQIEDDETYVLISDGRDVLINEEYNTFIKKAIDMYKQNGDSIIFSSETGCCNIGGEYKGSREEYIEKIRNKFRELKPHDNESPYIYLNYGVIFGKCKDFKKMYDIMDMQPNYDDQGTIVLRITENKFGDFTLDYQTYLFSSLVGDQHLDWHDSEHKYFNATTGTYPSVLHFTGKNSHYESCAKRLFQIKDIKEDPIL
jgi:hypothetical protein